jgi:hypothetical protein
LGSPRWPRFERGAEERDCSYRGCLGFCGLREIAGVASMGLSENFRSCEPQWMERSCGNCSEPPAPERASTGSPTNHRVLTHFSRWPLKPDGREYIQIAGTKPNGLWLSDESQGPRSWRGWVMNHGCGDLIHRQDFSVDLQRVRHLKCRVDMLAFNHKFGRESEKAVVREFNWIDWRKYPFRTSIRTRSRARP